MEKHYVYKITNLKNNKIYIGVRTHPSPELDEYMGSGTCIQNVIKIEGIEYFKKEIIKTFDTREKAENYESSLLTEEFCNSPETYNIQRTSNFNGKMHGFRKDIWYDYFQEIRDKYMSGETLPSLGKQYHCDKGTIRIICSDIKRTNSESQQIRYQKATSGARDLEFDKIYLSELIKLYNEDKWSVNRIAKYFGKSTPFITKRLIENKIQLRDRKDNIEKPMKKDRPEVWEAKNEIISLYEKGYTLSDLGRKYKCNNNLIRIILTQNNIKIRNKTENKILKLCQK